jgi:hypothetical protein
MQHSRRGTDRGFARYGREGLGLYLTAREDCMRSGSISAFPVRRAMPRYSVAFSATIIAASIAAWAGLGLATAFLF